MLNRSRLLSLLLVLVMLGSVISPVVAANTQTTCTYNSLPELPKEEGKKVIAKALSDKGVKKVKKELLDAGFELEEVKALKAKIKGEEDVVVAMFFKGKDGGVAVLTYAKGTGEVFAGVMKQGKLTLIQYDKITEQTVVIAFIDWWEVCMDICQIACGGGCAWGCGEICAWLGIGSIPAS